MAQLLEEKNRRLAKLHLLPYVRQTMPRFEANWHHKVQADYAERLDRGDIQNLMVWMPPRHTKSEMFAVRRPAWSIARDPKRQFMIASYGDKLAQTFSRSVRNTLRGPRSQQLFAIEFKTIGDTKWQVKRPAADDNEKDSMIAGGILGPFTGEGATDLIIDDPYKNKQDAYSSKIREAVWEQYTTALRTRLMPNGRMCIQQTRWHEDDLCGRLIKNAVNDKRATQWIVMCLAATNDDGKASYIWNTRSGEKDYFPKYEALWPKWFPREELERVRIDQGPTFWAAMYQQAPVAAEGSIFLRETWKRFEGLPSLERLVQVYDTAFEEGQENDYSASITIGQSAGKFPIMDAWRDRVSFPNLVMTVYDRWNACLPKYGRFPERLLVERKGSGISLIQQIEQNNLTGQWVTPEGKAIAVPAIPVFGMPAKESKEVRAHGISGYQNAGMILLPQVADWTSDFIDEHAAFPKGANDDWVDTTVHGVTYFTRPVEETEQPFVYEEHIAISPDLDEFDMSSW